MAREREAEAGNASFVEHLRLIHFTLMGACFVAMVAITSATPSSINLAHEETNQLLALKQHWQDGAWREQVIAEKVSTRAPTADWSRHPLDAPAAQRRIELLYALNELDRVGFVPPLPRERFTWLPEPRHGRTKKWFLLATKLGSDGTAITSDHNKFETIADARTVWNTLNRYPYLVVLKAPLDGWYFDKNAASFDLQLKLSGSEPLMAIEPPLVVHELYLYLRGDLLKYLSAVSEPEDKTSKAAALKISRDNSSCYLIADDVIPELYILRANCESEPLYLQALLVKELAPPRPGTGDFSHSFPNVDELTKNLSGLSLGDLQLFVAAERKRSGEKIELIGAKLPQETVAIWGLAILLVITGYFWAIFRDFSKRVRPGDIAWKVPWIGTSAEIVCRVGFAITLLAPTVTAAYLAWSAIKSEEVMLIQLIYGLAVLAVLAVTIGITTAHLAALGVRAYVRN